MKRFKVKTITGTQLVYVDTIIMEGIVFSQGNTVICWLGQELYFKCVVEYESFTVFREQMIDKHSRTIIWVD